MVQLRIFKALRNPDTLKGKCGACEYKVLCGGCRARAYGLSSDFIDYCGDLHKPTELKGDYLAEDLGVNTNQKSLKTKNLTLF
jgi:sulfatase maturation enzyme AslB (radical SAM superfamily)